MFWHNNRYIRKKQDQKLETKLFGSLQVLYLIDKQTYNLELSAKFKSGRLVNYQLNYFRKKGILSIDKRLKAIQ